MALSPAQLTTLKTYIDANHGAVPNTLDGAYQIAEAMDVAASPAWTVWRWQVPTIEIIESAELAKTTQAQTPTTAQTFVNQGIVSAQKLLVLSLLLNQDVFASRKANMRAALNDSLSNHYTTGAGAAQSAVGGVLAVLKRTATIAEKLFSSGTGSDATPANIGTYTDGNPIEGRLNYNDVFTARNPQV